MTSSVTSDLDLYVLCAGGHARVVIDILRRAGRKVVGVTDDDPRLHGGHVDDVPIIGARDQILARAPETLAVVNGLGNIARLGTPGLSHRRELFTLFRDRGFRFESVLSPDAHVSARAVLGEGVHVVTGAIVHPGCLIGANCIVNTGAQVDHDCRIAAHAHIGPGAVLCGNVVVGAGCHIGAGAVVVEGIVIGDGALVGAGAVVVDDISPGATVLGAPARVYEPTSV